MPLAALAPHSVGRRGKNKLFALPQKRFYGRRPLRARLRTSLTLGAAAGFARGGLALRSLVIDLGGADQRGQGRGFGATAVLVSIGPGSRDQESRRSVRRSERLSRYFDPITPGRQKRGACPMEQRFRERLGIGRRSRPPLCRTTRGRLRAGSLCSAAYGASNLLRALNTCACRQSQGRTTLVAGYISLRFA